MMDTVQAFIKEIKEKAHVQPLLSKADLSIEFITEMDRISMSFHDGNVLINSDRKSQYCEMIGKETGMIALMEGKEKLRSLAEKKALSIKAPFRTILLLESIFYLAKKEPD
ncbi:hypothetical protein ACF5W4_16075 [Bacillota bacterium Lsc_1132]